MASKAKRYTKEEKEEVLAFVAEKNSSTGRGGVAAAAREFKISQLTIASWVKKANGLNTTLSPKKLNTTADKLRRLAEISEIIDAKKAELDQLQAEFNKLKEETSL